MEWLRRCYFGDHESAILAEVIDTEARYQCVEKSAPCEGRKFFVRGGKEGVYYGEWQQYIEAKRKQSL